MAMTLQYNIEKASISIKRLTIIAGENSTGKTFITKSLYTILNSVYQNHFANQLFKYFYSLSHHLNYIKDNISNPETVDYFFYYNYIEYTQRIEDILTESLECKIEEQDDFIQKNKNLFKSFEKLIINYFEKRLKIQKFSKLKKDINDLLETLNALITILDNPDETIIQNIENSLETGFKKNFQITKLQSLINRNNEKTLRLDIKNVVDIEINQNSMIDFSFQKKGVQKIQDVNNIVFFDSPVYIKIRKALERKNSLSSLMDFGDSKYLKGYPEYIEQLYSFIDKEYIDISDFNLISEEIQEKILGKLDVSKGGDINFRDNKGNTIPLSLTAMGISNIGLIDLLLRNNIINKGSFLIMDEPEAHLHPEWQVFLAEILYKIAKNGANVILATHSLDFLKQFQVILNRENENASEIIAINKLPYNHEFSKKTELEKVDIVLDDLSRAFYNLYMQDI